MRLQILNLPAPADEWPYALVLDDVPMEAITDSSLAEFKALAKECGAVTGAMFADTVEVL